MSIQHVEFLVEEPSMAAFLKIILPQLLGGSSYAIYAHQGKKDLLKKLPNRLRGYKKWLPDRWRIVVIIDRDNDNCQQIKNQLEKIAESAGFVTKSKSKTNNWIVLNRLAIEELESWYFGDWQAVHRAYARVSASVHDNAKYRIPDNIKGGTWEAFERILKKAGYFKTGLRKIEAARTIAPFMQPEVNNSKSFQVLRDALRLFVNE